MRINILGVNISSINLPQSVDIISGWIASRDLNYVCVTPAHSIMECIHQPDLYPIFNGSGLTTPDGMSIVWILKLKGQSQVSRVYGPDLMQAVCQKSMDTGWRHFFYGGEQGVPEKLALKLTAAYPGLQIAGCYSPPFHPLSSQEDQEITDFINVSQPDIVWVGISTPKQERWMAEHKGRVTAPVMIGVGAAFDFLSGKKKQAPRWIQYNGLEWLFRLATEPRRLWKRYAQYPYFALLVLLQFLGIKHFPTE